MMVERVGFPSNFARSSDVGTRKRLQDWRLLADFRSTQPTTQLIATRFT